MNVESYRRRSAMEEKRARGRPAARATIKNTTPVSLRDNQTEQENNLGACDPEPIT